MAYVPPLIQCSVKNLCAVVKLALQNARTLVFRRVCFTGSNGNRIHILLMALLRHQHYMFSCRINTPLG